ncbi:MAG: proton-conducting transporter membrane subunit [Candidatus Aenigmarchaeota archaeon]|nr:proton-conducting transporter membrane subunit [Candidatus Aenigmarchaeota archaeon]
MIEYAIVVLLVGAFLTPVFKRSFVPLAAILFSFLVMASVFMQGQTVIMKFSGWSPPFGIVWVVDSFNALMGLLVTGMAMLVAIYSTKYVRERKSRFFTLLCLMTAGLLGVTLTGDVFNMYVFFEILSIACYGLVAFNTDKEAIEGALKYIVLGPLASSFILLGIAMLYGLTGTLNMADIALKVGPDIAFNVAFGFLIGGFALKSAIVPFHFWLPDVHPVAPSPISAMLSGVVVGTGVYTVMRIIFTIFGFSGIMWMFVAFGVLTMIIGGIIAIVQTNVKRMIAYSTVSQSGYIFLAFGLGTHLGVSAAIFHLVNNIVIKSLLFLAAGIIIWHTGKKDMRDLGGLGKQLPLVMICFGIGALSITGLPPLNGFVSKWMIYSATWEISPVLTAIAVIVSAMTLIYYMKAFSCVFLGHSKCEIKEKTPLAMLLPVIILAAVCVFLGVFPQLAIGVIERATGALLDQSQYITAVLGGG